MQRVLIVEDERIIALTIRQMLETLGYSVAGMAATGKQAVEAAHSLQPDIVLMDIHLRGATNGITAAHQISEQFDIPIVFLTAYAEEETLQKALATKPHGYLVKPVEARELHATLQMAVTRHQAEMNLARSEQRLRLALDAGNLGALEWEPATDRLVTVGQFHSILGATGNAPENNSWRAFLDAIHPEDLETVTHRIEQSLTRDERFELLFRSQDSSNRERWIQAHAVPHGRTSSRRLIGVFKDVTQQRRTEERLRLDAALLQTTEEGVFITDAAYNIVSINRAFTSITGFGEEESIGRQPIHLLQIEHPNDRFLTNNWCKDIRRWKGEVRLSRKGGELISASLSVSAVCDEDRLKHVVVAFSDITRIRQAEMELDYMAHHDALTGLPNRLLFNDRLDRSIERARLDQQLRLVMFLDLDRFKAINDTMGHSGGDILLQVIGARLTTALTVRDTVARQGGDEFVAVIENIASKEDASAFARQVLTAIASPIEIRGETVQVTGSIGLSLFPHDGIDRHTLLRAADTAMYQAKALGRNRYSFFTKTMSDIAAARMDIEQGLRRAVEGGQLTLRFQPLFSLADGRPSGVEALVRWVHPKRGILLPSEFVPVAEDTGIIEEIDDWVLRKSCTVMAGWLRAGGPRIRLAVNVSARQMVREGYLRTIRAALGETGFPPELLEIEITETALQRIEPRISILPEIRALGAHIAIDDFGTGYSSLARLRTLPFDRIKIDQSFVAGIAHNSGDLAIVTAIVGLSHTLGLRCTAEGVETQRQLELLKQAGCQEAQGFLLGRPLPFEQMLQMRWWS